MPQGAAELLHRPGVTSDFLHEQIIRVLTADGELGFERALVTELTLCGKHRRWKENLIDFAGFGQKEGRVTYIPDQDRHLVRTRTCSVRVWAAAWGQDNRVYSCACNPLHEKLSAG